MTFSRCLSLPVVLALVAGCADTDASAAKTKAKPEAAPEANVPNFSALDKDKTKTTASGLKYQDLKEGTGEAVKAGDLVEVNYTGWLTDGKQFDSSHARNRTFRLAVGAGEVIKGWDEGLVGMKEGGTRKLE